MQLTDSEAMSLRSQIATSKQTAAGRGGRRYQPYAFTEHGAIMAATILNSPRAVEMSVYVVSESRRRHAASVPGRVWRDTGADGADDHSAVTRCSTDTQGRWKRFRNAGMPNLCDWAVMPVVDNPPWSEEMLGPAVLKKGRGAQRAAGTPRHESTVRCATP
jgi:hypothetical protein